MLKDTLDARKDLAVYLYDKGYLLTNDASLNWDVYPFYGNWNTRQYSQWTIAVHKRAKLFMRESNGMLFFLIGHAYNPYTMDSEEDVILEKIATAFGTSACLEIINELTGVFVLGCIADNKVKIMVDASSMQCCFYGTVNGEQYITSHMRLPGDLNVLHTSDYVNRLIHYRWYHFMMGNYLPGDITCYDEFRRVLPNTIVSLEDGVYSMERIYPTREIAMCATEQEYNAVIEEAASILQNTLKLIPLKWSRPAISLTGGVDSNTTFAAANGTYDKYSTFSYVSMYRESIDAEKAKEISDHFGVSFSRYDIPENNTDIPDFDILKELLDRNDGNIGGNKDNDVRKKIFLIQHDVCDVEVKSWISETIRAYAYKYFGRKHFPKKLKPRAFTSLYKIFLLNRRLAMETDKFFAKYLSDSRFYEHSFNYDQTDFFVWEMMHGAKCGLNIGVMKSCFDITIPYNNRKLLDLLLRVPLEKRISDQHHMDLKRRMNPKLADMNIRVVNLNETKNRKRAINLYYIINTHLPF